MVNKVTFAGFKRGGIAPLSGSAPASTTGFLLIQICINWCLLLCNHLNETLTYLFVFNLKSCEAVILTSFQWKWPASCHVFVK